MQSEKIISHPNRIAANCQLANLHVSYCSAVGKLDVIWLVYHVHDADESAALEIPALRQQMISRTTAATEFAAAASTPRCPINEE